MASTDNNGHPNLTISGKLREKENFIFGGAPNLYDLPDDDRKLSSGQITKEDLEEFDRHEKRKKEKRKQRKKNIPSNADVRERLRIIAKYHKKEVEESMPCPYPLLGPAGEEDSDSDSEPEQRSNQSRKNKKAENSDVIPISYKNRSGQSKKKSSSQPPKKRGKKK